MSSTLLLICLNYPDSLKQALKILTTYLVLKRNDQVNIYTRDTAQISSISKSNDQPCTYSCCIKCTTVFTILPISAQEHLFVSTKVQYFAVLVLTSADSSTIIKSQVHGTAPIRIFPAPYIVSGTISLTWWFLIRKRTSK